MKIFASGERNSGRGATAWFTGVVWIDEIVTGAAPSRLKANRVSFEPGARTAWHTHPMGQALHVVAGLGRIQLKGQPVHEIRPGDSVWIDAGELHWHGAAAGSTMVHLAIQETDERGLNVEWLEHVTDEEYNGPLGKNILGS